MKKREENRILRCQVFFPIQESPVFSGRLGEYTPNAVIDRCGCRTRARTGRNVLHVSRAWVTHSVRMPCPAIVTACLIWQKTYCRNWAIAEVELGSTFAMRQAIWRTILTFSTAKLYKGSRVAYKFVQVVPNRANIMVTYPNQQDVVVSLTSSVNGISRVRIARVHRRSSRIACSIAKSFCESRFWGRPRSPIVFPKRNFFVWGWV